MAGNKGGGDYRLQANKIVATNVAVGDRATIHDNSRVDNAVAMSTVADLIAAIRQITAQDLSTKQAELACLELQSTLKQKDPDPSVVQAKLEGIVKIVESGGHVAERALTIFGFLKGIAAIVGVTVAGLGL